MTEKVTLYVDYDKAKELSELGYLLVMMQEFNTETQMHEVTFRQATWKDI